MHTNNQVNVRSLFEVCGAEWSWTPFGVRENIHRDRCSCRSYNFIVWSMEILNTRSEHQNFPTHVWLFSAQCGMLAGFNKTTQADEMQSYNIISMMFRLNTEKWREKNSNISKIHLSTQRLKSNAEIMICAISEIQWHTQVIKKWSNRTSFQVRWSRPTLDWSTISAQ